MAEFCIAVRSAELGIEWPFLSTNISQGSEATHLRSGGIFHYRFITNLLLSVSVKNRSAFGKVSGKNIVAPFFRAQCIYTFVPSSAYVVNFYPYYTFVLYYAFVLNQWHLF